MHPQNSDWLYPQSQLIPTEEDPNQSSLPTL